MDFLHNLFKKTQPGDRDPEARKSKIKQVLEKAQERNQLPELEEILDILVAVEQLTNYATVVQIALETAAEFRACYIGELKSAYMKFWWWWHNHRDEPRYRAEKLIVITGEAARVYPDSKIGWQLISFLLAWIHEGCPDRSNILKEHFGEIPTLDEIRKYQSTELGH